MLRTRLANHYAYRPLRVGRVDPPEHQVSVSQHLRGAIELLPDKQWNGRRNNDSRDDEIDDSEGRCPLPGRRALIQHRVVRTGRRFPLGR